MRPEKAGVRVGSISRATVLTSAASPARPGVSVHILASVTNGGHHGPFFIAVLVVIVLVVGGVIVSRFRRR